MIHVDAGRANAADGNPGSAGAPLRTIQAAAERALRIRATGAPVTILIHPGEYRESIALNGAVADPHAPELVFEGTGPAAAIISGTDVWRGWRPDGLRGVYQHDWPHRWGLAAVPPGWGPVLADLRAAPVIRRAEIVFVDGRLMRQVMSLEELRREEGTAFVEDAKLPAKQGSLWLHTEDGADPNRSTTEVGTRPVLFEANAIGSLVLRRLTFRHAATPLQDAAVRLNSVANVRVEDCDIVWNNWNGLAINASRDVTIRRVTANHNGAGGLGAWRVNHLVVEDTEASYNNWRGGWGGFTGWATGQKFFNLHDALFRRFRAIGNQATGLWLDTDHASIVMEQLRLCENATRGLFIEAAQGPVVLRDSIVCDNGETGVLATSAANVTLERNAITGNRDHQVWLPWMDEDHVLRREQDYETGQPLAIRSEHWTIIDNTITGKGESLLFSVGNWKPFFVSFQASRNRYQAERADAFGVYFRLRAGPVRMDLPAWQRLSGQDVTSVFRKD